MGALDHTDPVARVLARMTGVSGISYDCPNLEVVDMHINANAQRIHKIELNGNLAPRTAAQLRADVMMLLDRRYWLWWWSLPDDGDVPAREQL